MSSNTIEKPFGTQLLDWFDKHGRKDLPWQSPRTAYRVWVSEIMLQQTQVLTVISYFQAFMQRFPSLQSLAQATEDEVLALWSGLGYYSRARNLHHSAKILVDKYQGQFPEHAHVLEKLPGIGPSTAAAIVSQAFNLPAAVLDGNVKRVLSRYFLVEGWPQQAAVHKQLLQLAEQCLPSERYADYTQAIMDLGALCCTVKKPDCIHCPLSKNCLAYANDLVSVYPAKRPAKTLPTKAQQFLLLYNHKKQIYLEKRPPTGLWCGLWCLPAIDMETSPEDFLSQNHRLRVLGAVKDVMHFKHSFSHYHLNIHAKSLAVEIITGGDQIEEEKQAAWYDPHQLKGIGLAKPVSLILQRWYSDQGLSAK